MGFSCISPLSSYQAFYKLLGKKAVNAFWGFESHLRQDNWLFRQCKAYLQNRDVHQDQTTIEDIIEHWACALLNIAHIHHLKVHLKV